MKFVNYHLAQGAACSSVNCILTEKEEIDKWIETYNKHTHSWVALLEFEKWLKNKSRVYNTNMTKYSICLFSGYFTTENEKVKVVVFLSGNKGKFFTEVKMSRNGVDKEYKDFLNKIEEEIDNLTLYECLDYIEKLKTYFKENG